MLKLYKEHPEFDEYTKFDTETGRLFKISGPQFRSFLPRSTQTRKGRCIKRLDGMLATIFLGATPETHTRFPRRIYFQITRNCNLHCSYCFIKAEQGAPHVPTSAVMSIAEFLGRHGLMEVRLTGGEPTTHPDFFDIVRKFQEEGVYVSVATNGVWSRSVLEGLANLSNIWIICSIDGNRTTHNKYRPGTFDKIIANLTELKRLHPSARIRLTTVLTKENKGQIRALGEICKSVGAESITVIPLRPQVRDASIMNQMVSAREFKNAIEDMVAVKDELGVNFTTTLETDYSDDIWKDPVVRKKSSCAAGREATNLDYDASTDRFLVYGCSYSPAADLDAPDAVRRPFIAGSFSPDNISAFLDIWRSEQAWTLFRDLSLKYAGCKCCVYLKSHKCVGSCPIQNIDYSSIRAEKDVLAQLRTQIIHTAEWYCYRNLLGNPS